MRPDSVYRLVQGQWRRTLARGLDEVLYRYSGLTSSGLGRDVSGMHIHHIRGRIEKIFGTCKRSFGLRRMRWRGACKGRRSNSPLPRPTRTSTGESSEKGCRQNHRRTLVRRRQLPISIQRGGMPELSKVMTRSESNLLEVARLNRRFCRADAPFSRIRAVRRLPTEKPLS